MLGLFFFFVLAVHIGLICFWFLCLYRLFNWLGRQGKFLRRLTFRVPVILVFALVPFHNAVVYPLMLRECMSNGGAITYEKQKGVSEGILLDKAPTELANLETVASIFERTAIKSVHSTSDTSGIGHDIRNYANLNRSVTTALNIANEGDINCGPFYYHVAHYLSDSDLEKIHIPTSKCLAIDDSYLPESHIRVSTLENHQSSWRQIFHPINWKIIRYEKIENGVSTLLSEIKEFRHDGFGFPFFFNKWFETGSFGDYSCKSTQTPAKILFQVLNLEESSVQSVRLKWTKELGEKKYLEVKNRAMGFPLPDDVFVHDIMLYANNDLSTASRHLSINLTVLDHGLPVLLILHSAFSNDLNWYVSTASQNQLVFAQFSWQSGSHSVFGRGETQLFKIVETNDNTPDIQKFYLREFLATRFKGAISKKIVRVYKNGVDAKKNEIALKLGPNDPPESEILFGTLRQ